MEPLFFELTEVLKQQRAVVKEMITASEAQNQALRNNDLEALNNAVEQLNKLTQQMAKLDPQREAVQVKLEEILKLQQQATVSNLLAAAPIKIKIELKQIQMELKKDFQQLQEINEINSILTKRAQQINTAILKMFNLTGSQTYQNSGTLKKDHRPQTVLNKTV